MPRSSQSQRLLSLSNNEYAFGFTLYNLHKNLGAICRESEASEARVTLHTGDGSPYDVIFREGSIFVESDRGFSEMNNAIQPFIDQFG